MSAIWGAISFEGNLSSDIDAKMQMPYKNKCKIERYESLLQDNIYMGCGIQYTTAEAVNERLPIKSSDGKIFFTADCILDNRDELVEALQASSSEPDGTLMYMAYEKWGMECLHHFQGLFSMAVYDSAKETLYIAADKAACRCLNYYRENNRITFSTLISPILSLYPQIAINEFYMKDYLTAPGLMPTIVPHETAYKNIFLLKPGCYMEITKNNIVEHRYWSPEKNRQKTRCKTAKEYGDAFVQTYDTCVKSALRTTGEVAIALSSGLDSSSVGALAARELATKDKSLYTYTYVPIKDITTSYRKTDIVNEKDGVMKLVEMYPNMIPHFTTNGGDNCFKYIPQVLSILEMPYKSVVNSPSLMEIYESAANTGCKIVLSGQCGNSSVSYGYIDNVLYDLYKNGHYIKFLKYLNHFSTTVKESRKQALKGCIRYFRSTTKILKQKGNFTYTPKNTFLSSVILENYPMEKRYTESGITLFDNVPLPQELYGDYLYSQGALTYLGAIDTKMGLTYGILLRDPTRDSRILSFCSALPYHLFAYGGVPRWLICGNFHGILPDSYLDNYLRYGVQNVDWFYRVTKDWDAILPEIRNALSLPHLKNQLDTEKILTYLEQPNICLDFKNCYTLEEIFFINIAIQFYQMQSSNNFDRKVYIS